jgi:predicted  nucleic acid-binding Zn-ribbon protein
MWTQFMNDPEFLRAAIAFLGAVATFLGGASTYVTWKARARMQELKNEYAEIKAQSDNQSRTLVVTREIIASNNKIQEASDKRMGEIIAQMKTTASINQQVLAQLQANAQMTADVNSSVMNEAAAIRDSVTKATNAIANLLRRFDGVERTLGENQQRHSVNAAKIKELADLAIKVETLLERVKVFLDKTATNENAAVKDEQA